MNVKVRIPTPLRGVTGGLADVESAAPSVGECIRELEARFPGFSARVLDENGEVRRFVNVFVNGEDIRFLDGLGTRLKAGDELSIVPAMAGGSRPTVETPPGALGLPRTAPSCRAPAARPAIGSATSPG